VLVARHFQYRVENFFKEIIMKGQLGKIIYYAIRVEFQVRGSPHVHCLLWANDVPKLNADTKQQYIEHVDSVMSARIPNENNSNLRKLVKTFQIHLHFKTCSKYNKEDIEDYEHFLSISPDKDFHLHLRHDLKSCFVNNFFSEGLIL